MSLGRGYKKDFFYYLLDAKDPETGEGFETKELWGEANVLMIAGLFPPILSIRPCWY